MDCGFLMAVGIIIVLMVLWKQAKSAPASKDDDDGDPFDFPPSILDP